MKLTQGTKAPPLDDWLNDEWWYHLLEVGEIKGRGDFLLVIQGRYSGKDNEFNFEILKSEGTNMDNQMEMFRI